MNSPDEYFSIEYDWGYINSNRLLVGCLSQNADLLISITNQIITHSRIKYLWYTCTCAIPPVSYQEIPETRKLLERSRGCNGQSWAKEFGNFKYNNGTSLTPNPFGIFPLDPRRDCILNYPDWPPQIHLFNYAYTVNDIDYYGASDIGKLTLNLTIEKNISTPDFLSWQFGMFDYPCVLPSPIVITNDATLKLASLVTMSMKKYIDANLGTDMIVESGGTFELDDAPVNQHTFLKVQEYCNFKVFENAKIKFGEYAEIFLERAGSSGTGGIMYLYPNSRIEHENMAEIQIKDYATLYDCGPIITGSGVFCILKHPNGTWNIGTQYCNPSMVRTFSNGEFAVIAGGPGAVNVASGCKIVFDGPGSYLKCEPGSVINFGQNALLEFRNGAYIEANGCTFTNLNSGERWSGIVLDDAGSQSTIQNCTFNSASTSISVSNTVCNISGNIINADNTNTGYGIDAFSVSDITIQNNIFNAGQNLTFEGIKIFNHETDGLPGGGGVPVYTLNIVGNTFNGGGHPIELLCVSSAQLPFYIAYNTFNPIPGVEAYGNFAYNITGTIKQNTFNTFNSIKAFTLMFANVNMFNNNLNSSEENLWVSNSTFLQMAPIQNSSGQWVWVGGNNNLRSNIYNNIYFTSGCFPTISPNGRNCFTVNTQPNYNFVGGICLGSKPYKAYDNFWIPAPSSSSFNLTCNGNPVNVTYEPYLTTCPSIDPNEDIDSYIYDLGNGIYDTVYVTSDGEGGSYPGTETTIKKSSNTADVLYFEAIQKRRQKDYSGAIDKCKDLLNNHDTSSYFNSVLSELYLNYLESDTTGNQVITNGLFNNLKTYIEQKMQQYQTNAQFVERAYKYLLMCLVKTKSYTEAIAGYENIMNNHPDPIVRLNASWDRSAVVFMMGQGGAENDLTVKSNNLRNKKLLDKNPAHRIASNIFNEQKETAKREEKNSELYNDDAVNINSGKYTKEEKAIIERRIENYNPTDKKDFMDKLSNDIKLIEQINTAKTTKRTISIVPKTYKLFQNYPNPFNPTTTIKYEIPKDAEVTIKVYDLLGREVFSINEYKKAGSYEVKFDGSNLASGMYFYSFEVNRYKDTKKMVLLK